MEIVRGVYARWGEGDFRASLDVLDPLVLMVQPPSFAEAGMYLGVEELVKFMRGFLESWSHMTIEAEDITEADGGTVVANVRQSGVGSGSRAKTDFRYSQVWSFRGGKVIRLENFREHAEALEAAGLSEWAMSQESLAAARCIYREVSARGEAPREFFDPTYEVDLTAAAPDLGVIPGLDAAEEALREYTWTFEDFRIELIEVIHADDRCVVTASSRRGAAGRERFRGLEPFLPCLDLPRREDRSTLVPHRPRRGPRSRRAGGVAASTAASGLLPLDQRSAATSLLPITTAVATDRQSRSPELSLQPCGRRRSYHRLPWVTPPG